MLRGLSKVLRAIIIIILSIGKLVKMLLYISSYLLVHHATPYKVPNRHPSIEEFVSRLEKFSLEERTKIAAPMQKYSPLIITVELYSDAETEQIKKRQI